MVRALWLGIMALASISVAQPVDPGGGPDLPAPSERVPESAVAEAARIEVSGVIDLTAEDHPNDAGGTINLTWALSGTGSLPDSLQVMRRDPSGAETTVAVLAGGSTSFHDTTAVDGTLYAYWIVSLKDQRAEAVSEECEAGSSAQWIHSGRIGMLVILTILSFFIFFFIETSRRGRQLYIREIAGLASVEDAVGRATEMGKPVLYIPGIMDMDDIQTIASMVILGRVALKTAEYGSPLLVPTCRSVVMSVAQEVVKESYLQAGRPDAFNRESIQYLTDDQFGYAAGVDGIMVRERPAAIFLLGTFYAESLILAETGRSVGAIQIAGTAMPSQIPFFVAACDYTLIGEELYAASAYLSKEPKLLGSLKGQDAAKLFFILLIITGVLTATIGGFWSPLRGVADFLRSLVAVN